MRAAILAVYEATNITEKPPQMLIKNLLGQDFGALNATKCPQRRPHITHKAEAIEKFLLRCLPHGFRPNGLNHSYSATAMAVKFSDVKTAIHSSMLNGNRKANSEISDLSFGAVRKLTPLK